MHLEIRHAQLADALKIAAVKSAVWLEEQTSLALITEAIADADHSTHIALCDDRIMGFVDGFFTAAQDGYKRWEVDLLAVHPDWRCQGIGKRLVVASLAAGCSGGAKTARAFIQINNFASQGVFAHCGFHTDRTVLGLYVSRSDIAFEISFPSASHAMLVKTFNYRGLWLEGELSRNSFLAGQTMSAQQGLDIVGVVIPFENQQGVQAALNAGYAQIEQYHCWCLNLNEAFDGK